VSLLDEKFVLPWLPPDRERLLEYDLSRAIDRVASRERPVIGVMSGLPVWGEEVNPLFQHPGEQHAREWAFITELKKDFTLKEIPLTATNIDSDIKVLLVAHPVGISDATQYAIDQFVIRGGKLLAFLDPHAYFDQQHGRGDNFTIAGDNAAKSSLDKLIHAWGLNMDPDRVVADTTFASRNMQTGDTMPTLLLVTDSGINQNDVVTCQIDNLVFPFAGALTGIPAEGLSETVLVKSSPDALLVDSMIATGAARQILRDFKSSNIEYPLAVRLSGEFKTAFPQINTLKKSKAGAEVVLVSDSDMLNDHVSVQIQNVMGHRIIRPMNGNANFVQSLVEDLAGDENLISSRSRASMDHPFTRVKAMEARAGKQWEEKLRDLENQQRDMDLKIKELQAHGGNDQNAILTSDQERELEKYQKAMAKVSHELKQVRANLREDTGALEFKTKVVNIAAMPFVVTISGLGLAAARARRRRVRCCATQAS